MRQDINEKYVKGQAPIQEVIVWDVKRYEQEIANLDHGENGVNRQIEDLVDSGILSLYSGRLETYNQKKILRSELLALKGGV